jgi:predicted AlkP superfamily phosphohydrolase/phosphomutase
MPARVLAIWFDAAEVTLLEEMMACGELPALAALRDRGAWGRLRTLEYAGPETSYGQVLTGQPPERTGNWMVARFDPARYALVSDQRISYGGLAPFYALGAGARVCVFDVPQIPLRSDVEGVQLLGWGSQSPWVPLCAHPPEVLDDLSSRFGLHPARPGLDHANLEDAESVRDLFERTLRGLELRAAIACDLLKRDAWDIFLAAFGELHGAGHYVWPNPACAEGQAAVGGASAIRTLYRAGDDVLARMVDAAGPEARCVVFSPLGMGQNHADLPAGAFLPELLLRYSFPGAAGLDFDDPSRPASPESQGGIKDWVMEAWHCRRRRTSAGDWMFRHLPLTWALHLARWTKSGLPLAHPSEPTLWGFQPVTWYCPFWHAMKAFALLTNSEGFIRINVRGREREGLVAPKHFTRICDELTGILEELRIPETGERAVNEVIRVREAPGSALGPGVHDADLVVKWNEGIRQSLHSPRFGSLGPLPMLRAGGHTRDGFLCAAGPGIASGVGFETGTPLDVAPTLLHLLGATPRKALPGRCLV